MVVGLLLVMMIATVGLPLIAIVTLRRRLQNCPVSVVFKMILMADVGLPSPIFTITIERGARGRPSIIFTITIRRI